MTLSLPFATQDQQYPFSYLRMGQQGYNGPGVVLSGDMAVSPGTGLQVQIAAGEAYVQQTVARLGSFYASRGLYYGFSASVSQPYNSITAPVTYPRVDQVIARVYDSYEQQLSGNSFWRYEWLTGTETDGAMLTNLDGAAALPDNSLRLAYCLSTVGMSSWSSDNILNIGVPIRTFPGSVNVTGTIEVGGETILSCTVTQPTQSLGTAYQPNLYRPTFVTYYGSVNGVSQIMGAKIGSTSSPSTLVSEVGGSGTTVVYGSGSFIAPPAWYYELYAVSGSPTLLGVTEITL